MTTWHFDLKHMCIQNFIQLTWLMFVRFVASNEYKNSVITNDINI